VPPASTEKQKPTGFFANLIDLYFSPAEAFANMLKKPAFLVPMMVHVALSLAFTGIWLQKVDAKAFVKARIEESPRAARLSSEQIEAGASQQAGMIGPISWVSGVIAPPILTFALGGLFLFVFRFFYGGEVTYPQSLTIVASTFASVGLLTTPAMLGVLALKGDWTIPPQEALQANLTLLLDRHETAKWLWAVAGSLDLISLWMIFLLATGFGVASKKSWSWALAGILVPWGLFVVCKAALASFF
jgi:hypothetical protein